MRFRRSRSLDHWSASIEAEQLSLYCYAPCILTHIATVTRVRAALQGDAVVLNSLRVAVYARTLAATPTIPTSHCSSTAPPVAILPTGTNESAGLCELDELRPQREEASRSAVAGDWLVAHCEQEEDVGAPSDWLSREDW